MPQHSKYDNETNLISQASRFNLFFLFQFKYELFLALLWHITDSGPNMAQATAVLLDNNKWILI